MVERIPSITGAKTRLYIIHGCSMVFTTAIYFIVCESLNSENNLPIYSHTRLIMILAAAVLANHSLRTRTYVTNHPQLKQYICVTRVCNSKNMRTSNHACTCMYNKCTTHLHLSIQNIFHETIILTTSSALSIIIYACGNILGGIRSYQYTGTPKTYCICSYCS